MNSKAPQMNWAVTNISTSGYRSAKPRRTRAAAGVTGSGGPERDFASAGRPGPDRLAKLRSSAVNRSSATGCLPRAVIRELPEQRLVRIHDGGQVVACRDLQAGPRKRATRGAILQQPDGGRREIR